MQFIGACTRKPNLCIVFEYMSGGSVYDYIRREGPLKLSQILKVAVEVSRGMDYLHQRKIIHRWAIPALLLLYCCSSPGELIVSICQTAGGACRSVFTSVLFAVIYMLCMHPT